MHLSGFFVGVTPLDDVVAGLAVGAFDLLFRNPYSDNYLADREVVDNGENVLALSSAFLIIFTAADPLSIFPRNFIEAIRTFRPYLEA